MQAMVSTATVSLTHAGAWTAHRHIHTQSVLHRYTGAKGDRVACWLPSNQPLATLAGSVISFQVPLGPTIGE